VRKPAVVVAGSLFLPNPMQRLPLRLLRKLVQWDASNQE
jgi:hypothetical protein